MPPTRSAVLHARVLDHVERIWGTDDGQANRSIANLLIAAIGIDPEALPGPRRRWSEADVALITYGDSIVSDDEAPLRALSTLVGAQLHDAISIVHVLPFSPYSSDRGFSVIDYTAVDPNLGTWADMAELAQHVDLMFDLVLNHCSAKSEWFEQFLAGDPPGCDFVKTGDPSWDLRDVVRPRSTPLLTPFETTDGQEFVWTTFSDDQIDLDWSNPELVAAMLRIMDLYIEQGARLIRLDAVAYIWKVPGTRCIHLPETHEMVKLLHTLLAARAPEVSIITETNVPDRENRSYFGDSDEAHLIYNFTLPPLTIDAVLNGRADRLVEWMATTPAPPPGTTLFNFLASHDGIGVRPAEGFLTTEEIAELVEVGHSRGGLHGTYDRDGEPLPYELNISFPDLFGGAEDPLMVPRILLLHAVVLALAGVPAIYVNSLMATTNDRAAYEVDGIRRSINRGRIDLADVPDPESDSWQGRIFGGLIELAALRRRHPAFHPEGAQNLRDLDGVLAIDRTSPDSSESITVLCNMTDQPRTLTIDGVWHELRTQTSGSDTIELAPYATAWLGSSLA